MTENRDSIPVKSCMQCLLDSFSPENSSVVSSPSRNKLKLFFAVGTKAIREQITDPLIHHIFII